MQKSSWSLITGTFQPETLLTYQMQATGRGAIFWLMMLVFTMSVIFNNQLNGIIQRLKDFFIGFQQSFFNHCTLNFKGGEV
jgi:hypothetical protein